MQDKPPTARREIKPSPQQPLTVLLHSRFKHGIVWQNENKDQKNPYTCILLYLCTSKKWTDLLEHFEGYATIAASKKK